MFSNFILANHYLSPGYGNLGIDKTFKLIKFLEIAAFEIYNDLQRFRIKKIITIIRGNVGTYLFVDYTPCLVHFWNIMVHFWSKDLRIKQYVWRYLWLWCWNFFIFFFFKNNGNLPPRSFLRKLLFFFCCYDKKN